MKVAIIDPANFTPYRNLSLCAALEKTGHDATLFTSVFSYDPSLDLSRIKSSYFFLRLSTRITETFQTLRNNTALKLIRGIEYCFDMIRLCRHIRQYDYTVAAIEWSLIPLLDLYFIRRLKKADIKTALITHNLLSHPIYNGRNIWKRYMKKIYSEVDLLMPLTETTKELFISETGVSRAKVKAVYHGNFEIFRSQSGMTKDQARKELAISPESNVLLFFGIIWQYKGLECLLKAVRIAISRNSRIKLLVAGRLFSEKEKLYALPEFKAIRDYLIIHDHFIPMNEVERYFTASDVVMMPHIHNLHSGQHHLAYTFGRPVIASACGDSLEIVKDGKSGFLVPPADERALAATILHFFDLPQRERDKMGRHCRALSDRNGWDGIAHDLMRTFREAFNTA